MLVDHDLSHYELVSRKNRKWGNCANKSVTNNKAINQQG